MSCPPRHICWQQCDLQGAACVRELRLAARPGHTAATMKPVLQQGREQSLPQLSNRNSSRLPTHTSVN